MLALSIAALSYTAPVMRPAVGRAAAPPRAAAFDEQCVSTVAPSVHRNGDSPIHSGRHLSRSRAASIVPEGRVKRRGR